MRYRAPGARVLVLLLLASTAHAQTPDAPGPRAHHVTVAAGVSWSGTYSVGDATATLRTNAPGSTPAPFTLFSTRSAIDRAGGVLLRAGFALTKSITVEGGGSFSQPSLTTHLSQDAEQAAAIDASEQLHQFVIDVGALWFVPMHLGSKSRLFVAGGGGYLRQLHEERTLVETGRIVYLGTGLEVWLHGGHGPSKSLGLRTDLRANWRHNGIEFDGQTRVFPTLTAAVFIGL